MGSDNLLYIDRGVLTNLCATECAVEILQALPYCCATLNVVVEMPLFLWSTSRAGEELSARTEAPLISLLNSGVLEVHPAQRELYRQIFIVFACHFRDVQADLFTLATAHSATLAVDDGCTRRILHDIAPDLSLTSTLTLLQSWQIKHQLPDAVVQPALQSMAYKAQFMPLEDDPLLMWWEKIIK